MNNVVGRRAALGQADEDFAPGPGMPGYTGSPIYSNDPSAILSPYQTYGSPYSTPAPQPAPTVTVPRPTSGQVYATFGPSGTTDPTAGGTLPPGPSPRVNVPAASVASATVFGLPMWAVLGGAAVFGLVLSSSGKRRR